VQGDTRGRPRRGPIAARDGGFGPVDRFTSRLDVHEGIVAEPELHVRTQFELPPNEAAEPPEELTHHIVGPGRSRRRPQDLDQVGRIHRGQSLENEVGEQ
jgi:hypothetical protein